MNNKYEFDWRHDPRDHISWAPLSSPAPCLAWCWWLERWRESEPSSMKMCEGRSDRMQYFSNDFITCLKNIELNWVEYFYLLIFVFNLICKKCDSNKRTLLQHPRHITEIECTRPNHFICLTAMKLPITAAESSKYRAAHNIYRMAIQVVNNMTSHSINTMITNREKSICNCNSCVAVTRFLEFLGNAIPMHEN